MASKKATPLRAVDLEEDITPPIEVGNPDDDAPPPLISAEDQAGLDADEQEFARLRRDLPGAVGAAAAGIVAISVAKAPPKNEFFRTHPSFRPIVSLVNLEVGMEKQFFAVDPSMEVPLLGIGISFTPHTLYLTMTSAGAFTVIPVSCSHDNTYNQKEKGLLDGVKGWFRLYTDAENKAYRVFPAPVGRFDEPVFPQLSEAKIFRLSFRDKGRLLNSTDHELFLKWAARDVKK